MVKPFILIMIVSVTISACIVPSNPEPAPNPYQQAQIIEEHFTNDAAHLGLYSQERQAAIDRGLAKDSTIAYLWQQKAMPLFKQGKYDLGLKYIDKAVRYDADNWQPYRAFILAIFAQRYHEAIADFESCMAQWGNRYVMDHSYEFYIALCELQLNEFASAQERLHSLVTAQEAEHGADWVHYMNHFYLGIAYYERGELNAAIAAFDACLAQYPEFSDAIYYRAICIGRKGQKELATEQIEQARQYAATGYSFNEDNAIYVRYPYQVRWHLLN